MTKDFNPTSSRDYVPELVTGYKQINEGMNNYWTQEIDNYNYAASFAGNDLKAMGAMSEEISGILKKREDKKKEVDFAKGHMWFYENGVPNETQLAYDLATEELYEEGRAINEVRTDWEKKGGDIWTSVEFKKLNKAEQHGAVVAFVEGRLQEYNPSLNPKLKDATSYEEYKAAEATYRMDFFKQLGDINPALVHKHTNKKQREKESTAYNNWNATREAAIKEEEIVTAKKSLESCVLTGADGVNCMINFSNNYAGLYGGERGKARREGLGHILTLAKSGVLTENQTDKMLDMEYKHDDGHTTTYRQQYKVEANEIEDAVDDYRTSEYNRKQNENKINAHTETQEYLKKIPADKVGEKGYDLTIIKELEQVQINQRLKYNGHSDPYIQTALDSLNNDKNIIKSRKRDAELAYQNGTLNSETLKEYPLMVQLDPEIVKKAKAGDIVVVGAKEFSEDLEAMVKKKAKVTAGGFDDGANQLSRYFQAKFAKRSIEIYEALPEGEKHKAAQMAFEEIKLDFETETAKGPSESKYQDDNTNFISPTSQSAKEVLESATLVNRTTSKEQYYLKNMGYTALTSPRLFFSEQELITMQDDSASMGVLVIPEKAKRIAKYFDNLNAIDVVNLQREAIGMEPLTSVSLKAFDQLPSENKFLLNYSATSMTSARAWGTIDYSKLNGGAGIEVDDKYKGSVGIGEEYFASIRPDGKEVLKITKEVNLPFANTMAGVELVEHIEASGRTLDESKPIKDQLSKEDRRVYARFKYKYGDKQALSEMTYDEFKEEWAHVRSKN